MNNNFFPCFLNIKDKNCLVVGGGNVALRKINKLLKYGANVEVIAREIKDDIINLNVTFMFREFDKNDIAERFLVVAATDDSKLNDYIVHICDKNNILVNNATSKYKMNAKFCISIEKDNFQIGICANGNPKEAIKVKNKIRDYI